VQSTAEAFAANAELARTRCPKKRFVTSTMLKHGKASMSVTMLLVIKRTSQAEHNSRWTAHEVLAGPRKQSERFAREFRNVGLSRADVERTRIPCLPCLSRRRSFSRGERENGTPTCTRLFTAGDVLDAGEFRKTKLPVFYRMVISSEV
jgi:hypothetical protein